MRINRCRTCKSNKLITLFTLGNLSFTGKFSSAKKKIKKTHAAILPKSHPARIAFDELNSN